MEYIEENDWDFWREVGLHCAGYGSDSDAHLIQVFIETSKDDHWYESIANRLALDKFYVQLLIEILCSADYCEYGTSPRGAWAISEDYQSNLDELLSWYERKWGFEFSSPQPSIPQPGTDEQKE